MKLLRTAVVPSVALAVALSLALAPCLVTGAQAQDAPLTDAAAQARSDALSLEELVNAAYAYLERLPGGRFTLTPALRAEAEAVRDRRMLLSFAERALALLADHHAITGSSFADSWAVVPSYADLWVERLAGGYTVTAVRTGSPAAEAGVNAGMVLLAVDGVPIAQAVAGFWQDLGASGGSDSDSYAARVLAAGRRDRERHLLLRDAAGRSHEVRLPNLYRAGPVRSQVDWSIEGDALLIRFNDSLGHDGTIAQFDAAMANARPGQRIVLDLTDTPGGGNTSIARAVMGWCAQVPTPYQMHALPIELRDTGVARQWAEYVLPRAGASHSGPVEVRVGRWTGSMGEGLAIGMAQLGACVTGTAMAGLLGAVEDIELGESGVVVKLPVERLMAMDGTARELFVPQERCPA